MRDILEQLKNNNTTESTRDAYLGTWKNFNKFIIRLDYIPKNMGGEN